MKELFTVLGGLLSAMLYLYVKQKLKSINEDLGKVSWWVVFGNF